MQSRRRVVPELSVSSQGPQWHRGHYPSEWRFIAPSSTPPSRAMLSLPKPHRPTKWTPSPKPIRSIPPTAIHWADKVTSNIVVDIAKAHPNRPRRLLLAFAPRPLPQRGVTIGTANENMVNYGMLVIPPTKYCSVCEGTHVVSILKLIRRASFFFAGFVWAYYFVLTKVYGLASVPRTRIGLRLFLDLASAGLCSWVL